MTKLVSGWTLLTHIQINLYYLLNQLPPLILILPTNMPHNYKLLVIIFRKKAKTACVGVVKATGLHEKSPSQHAADLQCVEQLDVLKKAFFVEDHSKEVEFIRVDG